MARPLRLFVWIALNTSVLAACSDNATPTQPETTGPPSLSTRTLAAAANTWTPKAPLPFGYGASVGVTTNSAGQSVLYAFGGDDGGEEGFTGYRIQAYDLATNTWTAKRPQVYVTQLNGVGLIGGKLYFSGGFQYHSDGASYSNQLFAYDPAGDSLISKAAMPKYTSQGITGVIAGKLFVLPGVCSGEGWPFPGYCEQDPIRELFRYNPVTNAWNTRRSAPHYHRGGGGGVIDGRFYVVGGAEGFSEPTAKLDAYNPVTNTWKALRAMPTGGFANAAVLGKILYVVSTSVVNDKFVRHMYAYDPATNTWKSKTPPSTGGALGRITLNGHSYLLSVNPAGTALYTP